MKFVVLILGALVLMAGTAGAIDNLNQCMTLSNSVSADQNNTSFSVCYINSADSDSSFNQGATDYYLFSDATTRFILVDFTWDSLFGYGAWKIANPSQVDSVVIDSAYVSAFMYSGSSSDACTLVTYRLHTDIGYSGDGHFPSWDNPSSGVNWDGGGSFTADDLMPAEDSTLVNSISEFRYYFTNAMQAFADSTTRRTGLAFIVRDADSVLCLYSEEYALGGSLRLDVDIWYSEYGISSFESDSVTVLVDDALLYATDRTSITDSVCERYNYGVTESLMVMTYTSGTQHRAFPMIKPINLADSLPTNGYYIDSAICWLNVSTLIGGDLVFRAHRVKRAWAEGGANGAEDTTGASWVYTGTIDAEIETTIKWTTQGALSTAGDFISTAMDTITVTAAGWYPIQIRQPDAQGMYDERANLYSYSGFKIHKITGDSCWVASAEYGSNVPYFVFFYSWEVEPAPSEAVARPASIDDVIHRGAYIK